MMQAAEAGEGMQQVSRTGHVVPHSCIYMASVTRLAGVSISAGSDLVTSNQAGVQAKRQCFRAQVLGMVTSSAA